MEAAERVVRKDKDFGRLVMQLHSLCEGDWGSHALGRPLPPKRDLFWRRPDGLRLHVSVSLSHDLLHLPGHEADVDNHLNEGVRSDEDEDDGVLETGEEIDPEVYDVEEIDEDAGVEEEEEEEEDGVEVSTVAEESLRGMLEGWKARNKMKGKKKALDIEQLRTRLDAEPASGTKRKRNQDGHPEERTNETTTTTKEKEKEKEKETETETETPAEVEWFFGKKFFGDANFASFSPAEVGRVAGGAAQAIGGNNEERAPNGGDTITVSDDEDEDDVGSSAASSSHGNHEDEDDDDEDDSDAEAAAVVTREEELARATKKGLRECSQCGRVLHKSSFSNRQKKKKKKTNMRCKLCFKSKRAKVPAGRAIPHSLQY